VLRSVQHERKLYGVEAGQPFRLSRLEDGESILEDLGTGRVFLLTAFGGMNEAAFTKYLGKRSE
jgi:hypothetical protein